MNINKYKNIHEFDFKRIFIVIFLGLFSISSGANIVFAIGREEKDNARKEEDKTGFFASFNKEIKIAEIEELPEGADKKELLEEERMLNVRVSECLEEAWNNIRENRTGRGRELAREAFQIRSLGIEEILARVRKCQDSASLKREKQVLEISARGEKITELLVKARELLKQNEFEQAREYVRKAMALKEQTYYDLEKITEEDKPEDQTKPVENLQYYFDKAGEETKGETKIQEPDQEKIKRVAEFMRQAQDYLEKGQFDEARKYAEKTLSIDADDNKAISMLDDIERQEKEYREEQKRIALAKEEREKILKEKAQRENEERERLKRSEKVSRYLVTAKERLEDKNYEVARDYIRQADEIDPDNIKVKQMLDLIDERESKEKEFLRQEEQEKKRKEEEKAARIRAMQIADYLEWAKLQIGEKKFYRARMYVTLALKIDSNDKHALEMMEEINEAERGFEADRFKQIEKQTQKIIAKEQESRDSAENVIDKMRAMEIADYLEMARGQVEAKKFYRAKICLEMILRVDEDNDDAKEMLSVIEKEEKAEEKEREKRKQEEEKRRLAEIAAKEEEAKKQAIQMKEDRIAGYLEKAEEYLKGNQYDRAREQAKKGLEIETKNTAVLSFLTKAEQKEKEYKLEQERFEKEKEERAERINRTKEYLEKAGIELKSGRFDSARDNLGKVFVLDKDNKDAEVLDLKINIEEEKCRSKQEEKKREEENERKKAEAKEKRQKYLDKADVLLKAGKFAEARQFVKKTFEIEENKDTVLLLKRIDEEEKIHKEEQRQLKIRQDKNALLEKQIKQKIQKYIKTAKKESDNNDFDQARKVVEEIFLLEKDNKEAERLLTEINKADREYKEYVEARKRKKEEENRKKKNREPEEKIKNNLDKAKNALRENRFKKAMDYANKALKFQENKETKDLIALIKEAEVKYGSKEAEEKRHKALQSRAEKKVEEQAVKELRQKKEGKKVSALIEKARLEFSKKDFSEARRYAYEAKELAPENSEIAELISDINKEDMFVSRENQEDETEKKVEKALKKTAEQKDPFTSLDEGKGWIENTAGIFKKKKVELNEIDDGETYTIDECVRLALLRSQRVVVADKQVKLAEMRVWETRRDLFPEVTGKIERSTGKIGTNDGPRHYHGEKYLVELKHNIFNGMGTWFELRQTQANLDVVKLEREKIKNEVIEAVKKAYYNLDKSVKALDVQTEYKEMVNGFYDLTEESYKQELIPRAEYLKVRGQNMQSNFQYASSKEDITLAQMMLFQEMNMEPEKHIEIKPVNIPSERMAIGLENCYNLAAANRPDLKIKEKMIEYYSYERKMKKAVAWPKIDFEGTFGKAVEIYQPTEDPDEDRALSPEWYAGIKGSVPLWGNTFECNYVREKWPPVVSSFHGTESATTYLSLKLLDNLAYFTDLQDSRVGFDNAKYEYMKAKKDLSVEVKEIYFKYRKALLQIEVAEAQVEHQSMFVKVLEERRKFGEMETSKVIEEYEKLAENEYSLIQGNANYFTSISELNRVIGIPEYFKPGYENEEYEEWKKGVIAELVKK
ncbi:MAG: TolC family protein [Candidatus Omnitrophota bacterium]